MKRIRLIEDKCTGCGECETACPEHAINLVSVFPEFCVQCSEQFCKSACPEGAFTYTNGVLTVTNACTGCGECETACPYNGITILNGLAHKCNLCIGLDGPRCVEACPEHALELVEDADLDLGFVVFPIRGDVKSSYGMAKIVESNGKLFYVLTMPSIPANVVSVLDSVIEKYRSQKDMADMFDELKGARIRSLILHELEQNRISLSDSELDFLISLVRMKTLGFEVLDLLLQDDNLEEIAVIGVGQDKPIYVYHRDYGMLETNIYFTSEDVLVNLINRLGMHQRKSISYRTPRMDAVLPDGSRVHAVIRPIALDGPKITIRKFRRRNYSITELISSGMLSVDAAAFLWVAFESDINALIVGNTGSGKTTLLNALAAFYPAQDRIIVVEDTPEIRTPHKHFVRIVDHPETDVSKSQLVLDTLRMRPDRVIVGEIRSPEDMKAYIDTCLAGQGKGSVATMHSRSSQEAIHRLISNGIPQSDVHSVDLIIVVRRWSDRSGNAVRRVVQISENSSKLHDIFSFDFKSDSLRLNNLGNFGTEFQIRTGKPLDQEIRNRAQFLQSLLDNNVFDYDDVFNKLRSY